LLHCLLDLPCLTAALQLSRVARMTYQQHTHSGRSAKVTGRLLDMFSDPTAKPLFNFILRTRGGVGDTIDRSVLVLLTFTYWLVKNNSDIKDKLSLCSPLSVP